jgi:predicted RNA-binding protein with PIN domain
MNILIVDGYNALHAMPDLRPLLEKDREAARDRLIHRLSEFAVAAGVEVIVVFDARGDQAVVEKAVDGINVRFGNGRRSADQIIERRVFELRERGMRDVVVATNDRAIGDVVVPMGAAVISIATLIADLSHHRRGPQSKPSTPSSRSGRLEDQIDPDLRAQLEAMRRNKG